MDQNPLRALATKRCYALPSSGAQKQISTIASTSGLPPFHKPQPNFRNAHAEPTSRAQTSTTIKIPRSNRLRRRSSANWGMRKGPLLSTRIIVRDNRARNHCYPLGESVSTFTQPCSSICTQRIIVGLLDNRVCCWADWNIEHKAEPGCDD
ncbi:hypothetical protein Landi51_09258 [Colletotrichum acutatum]